MPGFDRSGPMGAGPMSGGMRGNCDTANLSSRGKCASGFGRGRGCRKGRSETGRFGRDFRAEDRVSSFTTQSTGSIDEMESLTRQTQKMDTELQRLKKRIDEL